MQGWEGEFLEKASIITFSLLHPDTYCALSTYSQSMQSHHNKTHTHTLTNLKESQRRSCNSSRLWHKTNRDLWKVDLRKELLGRIGRFLCLLHAGKLAGDWLCTTCNLAKGILNGQLLKSLVLLCCVKQLS